MARQASWLPMRNAVAPLTALRDHIVATVRFGRLASQHADVVAELEDVLGFVLGKGAQAEQRPGYTPGMNQQRRDVRGRGPVGGRGAARGVAQ